MKGRRARPAAIAIRVGTLDRMGLLAGTLFGIWLESNPVALSATAQFEIQQTTIGSLNGVLSALGLVRIECGLTQFTNLKGTS